MFYVAFVIVGASFLRHGFVMNVYGSTWALYEHMAHKSDDADGKIHREKEVMREREKEKRYEQAKTVELVNN